MVASEQYTRQVPEHDLAPELLREPWAEAQRNGTDQLTMGEMDAEIAAARKPWPERRWQPVSWSFWTPTSLPPLLRQLLGPSARVLVFALNDALPTCDKWT